MTAPRRRAAAQALTQQAALAEVISAFVERGVRALLIKGSVTARLLGVDPIVRPSVDLDLLVAESALPAAAEALAVLGFQDRYRAARPSELALAPHGQTWTRGGPFPVVVDLHHSLYHVRSPEMLFLALSRDAHSIAVGRTMVEVPGDGGCALIIALHAAQHGRGVVKTVEDLRGAIRYVPEKTWHQAAMLAGELGVVGPFAVGLRLVDGGAALADRLGVRGSVTVSDHLRAQSAPNGPLWIDQLRRAPTFGAAATVLHDALLPSPAAVRANHPDLGQSRGRLAAYYVLRWLRIPRALVLYARVRVRHVDE